jgi:biopolymer transport protein ExbB
VEKAITTAASIETALLERGLIWLATVANIAPLLGFLGTVSGMIHAFEAIAAAEEVSAKLVATGIYEALITTAAGLIVAIRCRPRTTTSSPGSTSS